jgi:hypothetical protein
LGARTAIAAAVDEFFNRVTLLLPGDGTNGAQNNTFLDSSTNNFTITRNGNTTQGTFSPFSQTGWGVFTSDRNYLTIPASSDFDLISTDFTVEFFVNVSAFNTMASSGSNFFGNGLATAVNGWSMGFAGSGSTVTSIEFRTFTSGTQAANSFTVSFPLNTWVHVALIRNGSGSNNLTMYVNGVQQGSAQTAVTYSSAGSTFVLGSGSYLQNSTYSGNAAYFISNVRVSKTVVYSANFTPPTSALPALASTTLLICASNRFINLGTNTGAITTAGWNTTTPSIQPFSPFAPTIPYSAATVGGSGYFDGTGDSLSVASNAAFTLGTADFTLEFWLYPTSATQRNITFPTVGAPILYMNASSQLQFENYGAPPSINTTSTLRLNAWNHCVASRVSGTTRLFINGVEGVSSTAFSATNFVQSSVNIGTDAGTTFCNGYMADVRIVKGSGVTSVTVPTAPLTNITNTSLLLNYTNAGITDATAKNDLETVGNAQISTAQSKFGGSSMLFNGTSDYLVVPPTPNLLIGTGDFTLEAWVNATNFSAARALFSFANNNVFYFNTSGVPTYGIFGVSDTALGTTALSTSTWVHVAFVRSGSTITCYFNGTSTGTVSSSASIGSATVVNYVGFHRSGNYWNGYIDDLRVSRFARYTANFTAPTAAFPLQ